MNREFQDTPHVIREEMANDEGFRLTNDTIIQYGVELHVVVDPPVWEKFYDLEGKSDRAMKRVREYVSQVINGVALIYKSIHGHTFSIDVTLKAITVLKNEADEPYKTAKLFYENGMLSINDNAYLRAFSDFVLNTPGMPSQSDVDHTMMLTGLGAKHDDEVGCSQGNIMWTTLLNAGNEYSHKAWEFSDCSINAFENILVNKSCVQEAATFNNKIEYDHYNKLYPGQIYSAEEQCKIAFVPYSRRCRSPFPNHECLAFSCYNPKKNVCIIQAAANGTQCRKGNKWWCIDGLCVSKHYRNGKMTPTPKSTISAVYLPSCKDSDVCKLLYEVYNEKQKIKFPLRR
ncbi:hypothetical protein ACJMK2_017980, partial [Sinanodonta woodiana]